MTELHGIKTRRREDGRIGNIVEYLLQDFLEEAHGVHRQDLGLDADLSATIGSGCRCRTREAGGIDGRRAKDGSERSVGRRLFPEEIEE
ncbi:hypothetical protein BHE74_00045466 [Ensete ventricosum]|nr:hypothetical protein GW17_00013680 [Ensete ventricosum]RWW48456.1 hypothetical protein BHE74_00045466 [Ensete ventricosum]RZS12378.1 hypothetical protein BHM03_00043810 [Ensete ventricosum]